MKHRVVDDVELKPQKDADARHYLDQSLRPAEIVCGHSMTWQQHQERTVRALDQVSCKECYEKLLKRGHTIRGKAKADYGGGRW